MLEKELEELTLFDLMGIADTVKKMIGEKLENGFRYAGEVKEFIDGADEYKIFACYYDGDASLMPCMIADIDVDDVDKMVMLQIQPIGKK